MHIVEAIAVQLGLDAKAYNSEADRAIKTGDKLEGKLGDVEKQGQSLNKSFAGMAKGIQGAMKVLGGLFTLVASGTGLAKLVSDVQKVNNELYFLEKNLGMSAQTIRAWQGAAAAGGGSAEGMTNSMKGLNKSMNDFVVRGDTSLLPYMNALGVSMVDATGKLKDTDAMMLDLADSFSKMDREQAFSIGQDMGFDEGTLNTLLQGRDALKESLEYQKQMYTSSEAELEASRELAKNQAQLSAHWQSMKLMMGNAIIPLLVKLTDIAKIFFEFLQRHQTTVKHVFEGMSIILGAVLIPMLGKALVAALAFIAPFAPFILVVSALGAAFIALYDDYKTWAEGGESLFNWGAFADYIDKAKFSTDNLKNSFMNLGKELLGSTIPTLQGYADIVRMLLSGDFKGAAGLAKGMLAQLGRNIGARIDDLTGQAQGSFIDSASNLFGGNAPKGWQLGQTSSRFETGGRGAGTISSGKGDRGGVSYGSYQMSSKLGVVQDFLRKSGYGSQFNGLAVNSEEFKNKWRELAKNDPNFAAAQHDYIKRTHYDVQMSKLNKSGIDLSKRGAAVQDAIWSTSVQFGGGTGLISSALKGKDLSQMTDAEIVSAIQKYKLDNTSSLFKSSPSLWGGLRNRAKEEETALLRLAGNSDISNGALAAQQQMAQSARVSAPNTASGNKTNNVDVNVGDIKVFTTASSISGVVSDAMSSVSNQFYQLVSSMD